MATSPASSPLPPALAASLRARADGAGLLDFADFMDVVLYTPEVGYYRRPQSPVGREAGTDFFTATSVGPVFGALVAAACAKLLRDAGLGPEDFVFTEVGAEKGRSVLDGVEHPFAAVQTIGVGGALALDGQRVVFSNELFDAQPLHRLRWRDGAWREVGVQLHTGEDGATTLSEAELPALSARVAPIETTLPEDAVEGYQLDLPLAAGELATRIAAAPWRGLFVAFDYGKTWAELAHDTPQGTARAYHQHRLGNDLLAHPGEQDLTGHVCWDWIGGALTEHGFSIKPFASQESFFMHHATEAIQRIVTSPSAGPSPAKMAVMQLLHPANMGQKFQVLHALRPTPA